MSLTDGDLRWYNFEILRYNSLARVLDESDAFKLATDGFYHDSRTNDICCAACNAVVNGMSREQHNAESPRCRLYKMRFGGMAFEVGLDRLSDRRDFKSMQEIYLSTFEKWPHADISPTLLVKNGFICTGRGDETRCISCHCYVSQWTGDDIPFEKHFDHCKLKAQLQEPMQVVDIFCVACFVNEATHASLMCGHVSYCRFCVRPNFICPVCKQMCVANIDLTKF